MVVMVVRPLVWRSLRGRSAGSETGWAAVPTRPRSRLHLKPVKRRWGRGMALARYLTLFRLRAAMRLVRRTAPWRSNWHEAGVGAAGRDGCCGCVWVAWVRVWG